MPVHALGSGEAAITSSSNISPLQLTPSTSADPPSHISLKGSFWLTSNCILYVNKDGGTTWEKIGAQ